MVGLYCTTKAIITTIIHAILSTRVLFGTHPRVSTTQPMVDIVRSEVGIRWCLVITVVMWSPSTMEITVVFKEQQLL